MREVREGRKGETDERERASERIESETGRRGGEDEINRWRGT